MTVLSPLSSSSRPTLDWRQADDDVFVATSAGEYAGFVGTTLCGYEAHSARGENLGTHDTRAAARHAVAASLIHIPAPQSRAARHARAHRAHRRGTPNITAARALL